MTFCSTNDKQFLRIGSHPEVRVGFWQNGFFRRFLFFGPPDFFRRFCRRIFSPHFCGKKCPDKKKKPPGKSPVKSSKFYTTKIPDTFLQRRRANRSDCKKGSDLLACIWIWTPRVNRGVGLSVTTFPGWHSRECLCSVNGKQISKTNCAQTMISKFPKGLKVGALLASVSCFVDFRTDRVT